MIEIFLLILTFLSFANPFVQIPFFIFSYPILFLYLTQKTNNLKRLFIVSWMYGSFVYIFCLYWIYFPVSTYTNIPLIIAIWSPVLLGIYLGLYPAIFTFFCFFAQKLNWFLKGIFLGITWCSLEYIRAFLFTGFPWLNLTQVFAKYPLLIQIIQFTGSILFSGIIVCIVVWIFHTKKRNLYPLFIGTTSIAVIFVINFYLYNLPIDKKDRLSILIVQGNIDQYKKWDIKFQNFTINKYIKLTKENLKKDTKLVIWPETAMVFYLESDKYLTKKLLDFSNKNNFFLITGAPAYKIISNNKINFFNRAYLLYKGNIVDYYDKVHLVPFGEYMPLSNFLPFLEKIVEGPGNFSSGHSLKPLKFADVAIGTLICYEIIFPELVANMVDGGAHLLVNISNDAWFGETSGPFQHLNQSVIRAIESGRYILRATNTGISAIISPKGQIIKSLKLNTEGTLSYDNVYFVTNKTFYVRYHKWIKLINILIWMIFVIYITRYELKFHLGYKLWQKK